jgi:hypothetical protein
MVNRTTISRSLSNAMLFLLVSLFSLTTAFSQDTKEEIDQDYGIRKIKVETKSFSKGLPGQQDALTKAYLEALNIWFNIQEVRDQKDIFKKQISSQYKEYVVSERILKVTDEFDGIRMEVEVYLDESLLRFDLASLLFPELHPKPKVSFLISENLTGNKGVLVNSGEGYTMLMKLFEDTKFNANIDPDFQHAVDPTQNELIGFLNQGMTGILRYAKMMRSDIVVTGLVKTFTVNPENADTESPIKLLRGEAALQVVRVPDGKIFQLVSAEAEVKSRNVVEGSRGVARDVVYKIQREALISAVFASLSMPDTSNQFRLKVVGEGVSKVWRNLSQQLAFHPDISQFQTIYTRFSMSEAQFNFVGSVSAIVDELQGTSFNGFKLEPHMIAGQEMEFKLVSADDL